MLGSAFRVSRPSSWRHCSGGYASKAALHAMTRAMAKEWAASGVRANAVAPGPVMTDMVRSVNDEAFIQAMVDSTEQKRIAEPEEIVPAVLLLASDAGSYMTGSTITVDGGSMA